MPYTIQNENVYSAAFAGAISGIQNSNPSTESFELNSTTYGSTVADAFAQEVDTLWGSSYAPSIFEVPAIQSACAGYWRNRSLPHVNSLTPSIFAKDVGNLILTIANATAKILADGNTLPAYGGGSSISPVSTSLKNAFTQPAVNSNVSATIADNGWAAKNALPGQTLFIEGGGWYQIVSVADPVIVLTNLGGPDNGLPTFSISAGSQVLPSNIEPSSIPTMMMFVTSDETTAGTWGSFTSPLATAYLYVQAGQVVRLIALVRCLLGVVTDPAFIQAAIYYNGATSASTPIAGGEFSTPVNSVQPNATISIVTLDITVETSGVIQYILVGGADVDSVTPAEIMDFTFSAETVNQN